MFGKLYFSVNKSKGNIISKQTKKRQQIVSYVSKYLLLISFITLIGILKRVWKYPYTPINTVIFILYTDFIFVKNKNENSTDISIGIHRSYLPSYISILTTKIFRSSL